MWGRTQEVLRLLSEEQLDVLREQGKYIVRTSYRVVEKGKRGGGGGGDGRY